MLFQSLSQCLVCDYYFLMFDSGVLLLHHLDELVRILLLKSDYITYERFVLSLVMFAGKKSEIVKMKK